jgi:hypothetical protein
LDFSLPTIESIDCWVEAAWQAFIMESIFIHRPAAIKVIDDRYRDNWPITFCAVCHGLLATS